MRARKFATQGTTFILAAAGVLSLGIGVGEPIWAAEHSGTSPEISLPEVIESTLHGCIIPVEFGGMERSLELELDDLSVVDAGVSATALQTPPEGQNPWLCYDINGFERPCTHTEEYERCIWAAEESLQQCMEDAGFWERARCRFRHDWDEFACDLAYFFLI